MDRFVFFFIAIIGSLTVSCTFNREEPMERDIQGHWVFDTSTLPNIGLGRVISKTRDNCGFEFYNDSCKLGCTFYRKSESNVCCGMSTGFSTKFNIKKDSLRLWDIEQNAWHTYFIESLTKDSLVLFDHNMNYNIKYIRPSDLTNRLFEGIIISKLFLGDSYNCIDESFYFDRLGNYYDDNSSDEHFGYRIDPKIVDCIFRKYDRLNIDFLKSEYIGGGTGASLHFCISFVKNGSIIKRVIDHQNTGPDELLQAYTFMISSLKKSKGNKINVNHPITKQVGKEGKIFRQKMMVK